MMHISGNIFWLLVTLGILITFHEYGHFRVGRFFGVKILRFSVGFGAPIWSRIGKDGVEYCVAWIPLGGYVKFADEREGEVAEGDRARAFNRAPLHARVLITLAGPVANVVFTVVALWLMFVLGRPDYTPTVGTVSGIAEQAGLHKGDRIAAIDGITVRGWTDAYTAIVQGAIEHADLKMQVVAPDGGERALTLPLSQLPKGLADAALVDAIGISASRPDVPAVVGTLNPGPARDAGIEAGDRVIAINDREVTSFNRMYELVQEEAAKDPTLHLRVLRDGNERKFEVVAKQGTNAQGKTAWLMQMNPVQVQDHDITVRYGVLESVPLALAETWLSAKRTAGIFAKMVTGAVSPKNLGGAIAISEAANQSAQMGLAAFLSFLALLSMNLAILNLLPVPILDGGHLVYYLIEWIKGGELSERAMVMSQYVGLVLILGLVGLAFVNDILRQL